MTFIQKITNFILQYKLLQTDGKYLVALSGGADSVALLRVMLYLHVDVEACHCNFHLRGKESDRDETFCIELCRQLNVPLHRIHFDTKEYASLHKVSLEMAARELRYQYFEQLRADIHANDICVAHHRDDQVETVLMNLIRGTGIKGLTGISPRRGHIIRPLLDVSKEEILQFLSSISQPYITDSSNLVDDVVRNKLRLNVLPKLKEINPAVYDNIASTSRHITEAEKMLVQYTNQLLVPLNEKKGITEINKTWLLKQSSPEYLLHTIIAPLGFSGKVIDSIIANIEHVGKTWESETHIILIDRDNFFIQAKKSILEFKPFKILEEGNYCFLQNKKIKVSLYPCEPLFTPSKERGRITLDASLVKFPLTLRRYTNGDRFQPFGMKSTKLVSDYLTDRKKTLFEKQQQLVLTDANGMIIWLVNERTSDKVKINESTSKVLEIAIVSLMDK